MVFKDRRDAGAQLAEKLRHYAGRSDVIVLGLPRGGVVVGDEVASALSCPLDVLIVRKIGFPTEPELAVGAVSETGTVVLNKDIVSHYGVTDRYLDEETAAQKKELSRRQSLYRGGAGVVPLSGRIVIIVDDGVATGATMRAALVTLKEEKIARLVAALPVASQKAEAELSPLADEWVCLQAPEDFRAVGGYYRDFRQVGDDEVIRILNRYRG